MIAYLNDPITGSSTSVGVSDYEELVSELIRWYNLDVMVVAE